MRGIEMHVVRERLAHRVRRLRAAARQVMDEDATPPWGGAGVLAASTLRALRNYVQDAAGTRAAAIAYYSLLSFFPFVVLLTVLSSFFVGDSPEEVRRFVGQIRVFAPFVDDDFWKSVLKFTERRAVLSVASGALLFLVASRVFVATERAMRAIFQAPRRSHGKLPARVIHRLQAFLMTLAALVALGALFTLRNLVTWLRGVDARGVDVLTWILDRPLVTGHLLPLLLVWFLVYLLYKRVPRVPVADRWAALGATIFSLGHEGGLFLYGTYVARAGSQDILYGSFVGLISLVIWVYCLSSILLLSAELVAELNGSRRSQRGGAPAADARHEQGTGHEEHGDGGDRGPLVAGRP